jgi:exodeoxyribonuclease-3
VVRSGDADIVVLQEATRPDVVERVAKLAGMTAWGAQPDHSVGFMSRVPIARHAWHHPAWSKRSFLELVPEGDAVRVYGVHLSAVHSNWTEQRRARELRALLAAIKEHQHGFHVVTGDFNTLAPGEQLDVQRLPFRLQAVLWLTGGRIRWETIQIMLDAKYLDVYRMLHEKDPGFTFPTWDPHLRLDYVFVPGASAGRLKACRVLSEAPGLKEASDHLPLLAEVD